MCEPNRAEQVSSDGRAGGVFNHEVLALLVDRVTITMHRTDFDLM